MKIVSENLEKTQEVANNFVNELLPQGTTATVVGLYGNLGAGKTTLTQCIAKSLGVVETVNSPTFVLEKIYELENQKFTHLIHIDAYRIENSDELLHLGWNEIVSDPNNLILIEWPERVANILPKHIRLNLSHISENSREIEMVI